MAVTWIWLCLLAASAWAHTLIGWRRQLLSSQPSHNISPFFPVIPGGFFKWDKSTTAPKAEEPLSTTQLPLIRTAYHIDICGTFVKPVYLQTWTGSEGTASSAFSTRAASSMAKDDLKLKLQGHGCDMAFVVYRTSLIPLNLDVW